MLFKVSRLEQAATSASNHINVDLFIFFILFFIFHDLNQESLNSSLRQFSFTIH